MPEHSVVKRWRHSAFLVFLLGGISGALLNFCLTLAFYKIFSWKPGWAFFTGTMLNQAFHYIYYNVVYVNREIQLKTSPILHVLMSVCVSAGSALLLVFFIRLGWEPPWAIAVCLFILALLNSLLNRISTFSSAKMAEMEYREMNESYYEDFTDEKKVSRFRAWYHRSRHERLTRFVSRHFKKGMELADLGCGNCLWNVDGLPVFGVDINAQMLQWAKKKKRLKAFKVCDDLARTGLPSKKFDMVLISETLEHVFDLDEVLTEVRRILKDDGTFLLTVPYDYFLGPFFILFNLNCLYMGYLRGSRYHKYRCGHIHHFTKSRLRKALETTGFKLTDVFVVNGLLLYGTAKKGDFIGNKT